MSNITIAKKPYVWVCGVGTLCCLFILQQNIKGVYKFAVDTRQYTVEQETEHRLGEFREQIRHVCTTDTTIEYTHKTTGLKAYLDHQHKLLYFAIAKVGCSFWKRIFKVLNYNNETSMFDIPNYKAHKGPGLVQANTREEVDKYLGTYTSFMFVRDPFARLFSGYIDKLFLPTAIGRKQGEMFFKQYGKRGKNSAMCEHDIRFSDFAHYMAEMLLARRVMNGHFILMSEQINPCDVNVTYVGKMEHFMEDTDFILSSVGIRLSDVSGKQEEEFDEMHEKGYMEDIIRRTFLYLELEQPCISRRKILQRLWMAFYIRGYLLKTQKMPNFTNPSNVSQQDIVNAAFRAYDMAPNSKKERSAQRKEAMMEAFSTLPIRTLWKLASALDTDCRIFDYNCNIDKRFPEANSIQPFYFKE